MEKYVPVAGIKFFISTLLLVSKMALSQVSITTVPYNPAVTNFDFYNPNNASNALSSIPAGWSFSSTGTPAYNGMTFLSSGTAGGYWAYYTLVLGENNLGALCSASTGNITYSVNYVNNTGGFITTLVFAWDYEQFRFSNTSGWDCNGTGALAGNTTIDSKDYTGANSSPLNLPTTTSVASFTLSGLMIANGSTFGISWTTTDVTTANNGIAIDNFAMNATATSSITLANGTIPAATVYQNTSSHVLYRVDVTQHITPVALNTASFTAAGTYAAANLSNLRLWYSTNSSFSIGTSTLLSTQVSGLGPGIKTFSGLSTVFLLGTNYLFLTTDLPCSTPGNNINIAAITTASLTFASGTKSSSGFTAGGSKTFSAPVLNAVSGQTICASKAVTPVTFVTAPAGLTVSWTNNNTSIGLAASGSGNIPGYVPFVSSNQTGTITATVSSGICTGNSVNFSIQVKINNQSSSVWTGAVSSTWFEPSNWSNCVCGSATDVTIAATSSPSFNPTLNTTGNVKSLTIDPGAILSVQSNQLLNVSGDWINNGTFNAQQGAVILAGTSAQTLGGSATTSFYGLSLTNTAGASLASAQQVTGNLLLTSGIFDTNNLLTLAAGPSGYGRIGTISSTADIIDNVTVQQYAAGGSTGWALFGKPLASTVTMADWNDNFPITCSTCPDGYNNFTSIYSYDETAPGTYSASAKYVPITSITDQVSSGKGYWVYLGNGYPNTTAINFEVTGTVAKSSCLSCSSPVTIPVSFTSNNGAEDDGWNLISNPLPSPISWTALRNSNANVDNAIYVYNADLNGGTGAHSSYVNGVSSDVTGGITNNIPMCQGFYIHATAPTVLTAGENVKTNTSPAFLRPAAVKPIFRLLMKDNSGFSDITTFYFEQGGTVAFQTDFDAYKVNFDPAFPFIAGLSGSVITSINGLPALPANLAIPVMAISPHTKVFTFSSLKSDFPDNVCAKLHDSYTGITTDILTSDYSCSLYDTTTISRFTLSFYTSTLSGVTQVLQPECGSPGGIIIAQGNNGGPWDFEWTKNGSSVKTSLNKPIADSLTGLDGGNYSVQIRTTGQCDHFLQYFSLDTIITPVATFAPDVFTTHLSNAGLIHFTNTSLDFISSSWDFGDGQGSSGVFSPSYNYVSAGIYTVCLIVQSSSFCTDTATQVVSAVDDVTNVGSNQNKDQIILLSSAKNMYRLQFLFKAATDVNICLYDLNGCSLMDDRIEKITSTYYMIDLSPFANGMYLLKIKADDEVSKSFKLIR